MLSIEVLRKLPIDKLLVTNALISDTISELDGLGRVLVRYSGTENKVRILVEGPKKEYIDNRATAIGKCISNELEAAV